MKRMVTCEHGLRSRAVVCEPCRTKRKTPQQPTREQLTARISELEATLAEYANEDQWGLDDSSGCYTIWWIGYEDDPRGSNGFDPARAILSGES